MMLVTSAIAGALVVGGGGAPASRTASRTSTPQMMPKFLKEMFPTLEKPEDATQAISDAFSGFFSAPAPPPIDVQEPSASIVAAGKAMPALGPVFNAEADLQAALTNLGSYDVDEVQGDIEATINSAPVVIYTYGLSPFSTEAVSVLESTGCKMENVELGAEWFALGPKGSATRVELRKAYGQGSLPHIFIGGEWVGGLSTGADGGLAGLVERDELVDKLRKAKAL